MLASPYDWIPDVCSEVQGRHLTSEVDDEIFDLWNTLDEVCNSVREGVHDQI